MLRKNGARTVGWTIERKFSLDLQQEGLESDLIQWSIQGNHSRLFLPYDGANVIKSDDSRCAKVEVDPSASFLRVEHHTLTCLPRTGTIVFAVRTYITPLTQIRDEGSGPLLAEACESMPEKFGIYKGRPIWGQEVCAWLRQKDSISDQNDLYASSNIKSNDSCPFSQ